MLHARPPEPERARRTWPAARAKSTPCQISYPDLTVLRADVLPNQSLDLAAVRTALRGLHHGADDGPNCLVVARLDLLDGVPIVGQRLLDDPVELVAAGLAEATVRDDRCGVAPFCDEHLEHVLGGIGRDIAAADHPDEARERGWFELGLLRSLVAYLRDQVVGYPVGQGPRVGGVRRQRSFEEVAQLTVVGELARLFLRDAELAREPFRALQRKLRQRFACALEDRLGWRQRHQVVFRKVAVVVGLLLRAER